MSDPALKLQAFAGPVANPVRTGREQRTVQIIWTAFAQRPGHRLQTLYDPDPVRAVRQLLADLRLAPGQVAARPQQLGDVALLRRMPADVPAEYRPGSVQPCAFIDGLSHQEVVEALAHLDGDAGFTPARDLTFFTIDELAQGFRWPIRGAVISGSPIDLDAPDLSAVA